MARKAVKNDFSRIQEALNQGSLVQLRTLINKGLQTSETAQLIESSLPSERVLIWQFVSDDRRAQVLSFLSDDVRNDLVQAMNINQLVDTISDMETDNLADILQPLPNRTINQILNLMSNQDRKRVEKILSYPEDTAGGLMNTDMVTIRADITLDVVLRFLRRYQVPERTDRIYVTNTKGKLVGILPMSTLLVETPESLVSELMDKNFTRVSAEESEEKVARIFQREGLISLPVIDAKNILLGRITFDDIFDAIYESGASSQVTKVQIDEDSDIYASVKRSLRGRLLWLCINLITAFIGSAVIGLFEESIEAVVALAVLLPIVASMGGIAGTQTLTIMIRGLALNQIQPSRLGWLVNREVQLSLVSGLLLACIVGITVYFWFGDSLLGLIISIAIIINLVIAGITGVFLPYILRILGVDPALAGGVVLTTVTDVVGFASFLGLATLLYS